MDPDDDMVMATYALLGSLEDGSLVSSDCCMRSRIWQRLPQELVEKILIFLPAKSICRQRVVSRDWRRLLSSADFFRSKEVVAPLPPVICGLDPYGVYGVGDFPPQHCVPVTPPRACRFVLSSAGKEFFKSIALNPEGEEMDEWTIHEDVDSGDGLVCLASEEDRSRDLVVANPATNTFRLLPKVPVHFFCLSRVAARLKLDEPYGTTFTLSWHRDGCDETSLFWMVGVYSSATNSWTVCKEFRPPTESGQMTPAGALVYNGLLFKLHSAEHGGYYCAWYSFHTGKFVSAGQAPVPQVVDSQMPEADVYSGAEWGFVEHAGIVYVVASIQAISTEVLHSFGIWKLDLTLLTCEQVAVTPVEVLDQLGFPLFDAYLRNSCVVGDFICLEVSTHSGTMQTVRVRSTGSGFNHVIAFHVTQLSWHVLYVETEDDDRLIPIPEASRSQYERRRLRLRSRKACEPLPWSFRLGARKVLPSYPLTRPNFYFRV